MLEYNELTYKSYKNFITAINKFEKIELPLLKILDYDSIAKYFNYVSEEKIKEIIKFCVEEQYPIRNFKELLIKSKNDTIENLFEYVKYKRINPQDSKSEKYYKLLYGDNYLYFFNKRSKISDVYTIEFWVKKGFSNDEALNQINNYKKNKATSKEGFIDRYGEKIGLEKYNKFQDTSKHTLNKYINEFGYEIGLKKWETYVNKKKK